MLEAMRRFLLLLALLVVLALGVWLALRSQRAETLVAHADLAASTQPQPTHAEPVESLDASNTTSPAREAQATATSTEAHAPAPAGPTARLRGHLLFADDRTPVADAGVELEILYAPPKTDPLPTNASTLPTRTLRARSSPDGTFTLDLPDGSVLVRARVPERESTLLDDRMLGVYTDAFEPLTQELAPRRLHGSSELELLVSSGLVLRGRVLAHDTHQPIAGANVRFDTGDSRAFETTSDVEGRFRVRGIAFLPRPAAMAHLVSLSAWHAEFARTEQALHEPAAGAEWPEVTLELERGLVVAGIVVDAAGAPVANVELVLRPLASPQQGALAELAGEWSTRSDDTGLFRFPPVPRFDSAWLVSKRTSVDAQHGFAATRTLLHGRDPFLVSIELRLLPDVVVAVEVLYPDGTRAKDTECCVLREDEDGRLRSAREDKRVVCAAARTTRLVAWGFARGGDEPGTLYRGETLVTPGGADAPVVARIQLAATGSRRAGLPERALSLGFGAGRWLNTSIELHLVDRASGLPLSGKPFAWIETSNSGSGSRLGEESMLRVGCEPGWQTLRIVVEGYQPRSLELETRDDEPQSVTLALERAR